MSFESKQELLATVVKRWTRSIGRAFVPEKVASKNKTVELTVLR